MQVEFKIPDIGTTDAVTVSDILVKVGDKVTLEQDLLMLETDKATMEVPSDMRVLL